MARAKAGFPTSWGNIRASIQPINGPASYATFTAPTTGGQVVELASTGLRNILWAEGSINWNGTTPGLYRAEVVGIEPGPVGGIDLPGMQVRLKWYVVATGAAVAAEVDLSEITVDLLLLGTN